MQNIKRKEPEWIQRNRDRSKERYHRMKSENHSLIHADSLLKHLSDLYGLGVSIPAEKFFEVDFPFGVCIGIISKYSQFDIVVGKYCYTIFSNQTIKIYLV